MTDLVQVLVARGRSVLHEGATHTEGATLMLPLADAAHLVAHGFVITPEQAASPGPIVIRAEDHGPAGVGLRSGAGLSWEDMKRLADLERAAHAPVPSADVTS